MKIENMQQMITHIEIRIRNLKQRLDIYGKAKDTLLVHNTQSRINELELLLMDIRGED